MSLCQRIGAALVPAFALAVLAALPGAALAKVRVAASINDLASIAASVGGDRVEVFAIARPNADVHRVEVLPSYMVKAARAQVYLAVGLGLDAWADGIIDGSRNRKLIKVDCSPGVPVLEKPTGRVDASMGDVHPNGNPHYWLDPRNGGAIARNIAAGLARADPAHASEYHARAETFAKTCAAAWSRQKAMADALPSKQVLTYHRSWSYFANAFGLEVAGNVEPVPGIPPTARHLASLQAIVRQRGVRVLIQEPYFSPDAGKFLRRQAGVAIVTASTSCDAPAAGSYLEHIDHVLTALRAGEGVAK
jgi:zinc/manganese transport system substrate-binding protein